MQLKWKKIQLPLKDCFTISKSTRTHTPSVLVKLEHQEIVGYGEASLPPYLGETQESVCSFLSSINLAALPELQFIDDVLHYVDQITPQNNAAKAAFDIALHDWVCKKMGIPCYQLFGLNPTKLAVSSFTIGIDSDEQIRRKVIDAAAFPILKVKLGTESDRSIISTIRDLTNKPIRVDINEGWNDKEYALYMAEWLASKGVELIEQPFPITMINETAWLKELSPIPILADESVKRLEDIPRCVGVFDGITVKLMKSTGMREAFKMMVAAQALGLKIMIGCMTESSCAISAAAHLASIADWVDLDGAALLKEDPFSGVTMIDGRLKIVTQPGHGGLPRLNWNE